MESTTVNQQMYALLVLYDMHTGFFSKAIDGISDEDAHNRLNTKANHVAWLAGSLVHERFELANQLGIDLQPAAAALFGGHKGIQEGTRYPSLTAFKKDWDAISPLLREAFENITEERLAERVEMPGAEMNFYDLVSFMTYREASCIGQIALWRRLMGYDALKYD
ncbi:MAG: DinB family protein [Ferruginibacter sp.]|nr:DinB family protein [Chitinophagaceae bacterium]